MKIGELAKHSGIAASTIRYYESIGLLPHGTRNNNGYRQYDKVSVEQLKMIKFAQSLGFSLEEIPSLRKPNEELDHNAIIERLGEKQHEANALIEQLQRKSERIANLITLLNANWSNGECIGDEKINELLNEVEY
ncbi:MerR family transcriptional regulator [Pseudoalteromonas sp. 2CM41L]|uniref:MerR family transcriptional regulator n=1 Tax=Pseudoalteromonas sp. 2CM41L TaxID=2929857 RepID=UPI0020C16C51|nr:MerR family transcriptional regulator [Pseudoalteromonas sp. 2CM41L]MCK8105443.1 MerR family transcriptional regulator [Pseudoalteromonas sp. 2CM41L]